MVILQPGISENPHGSPSPMLSAAPLPAPVLAVPPAPAPAFMPVLPPPPLRSAAGVAGHTLASPEAYRWPSTCMLSYPVMRHRSQGGGP